MSAARHLAVIGLGLFLLGGVSIDEEASSVTKEQLVRVSLQHKTRILVRAEPPDSPERRLAPALLDALEDRGGADGVLDLDELSKALGKQSGGAQYAAFGSSSPAERASFALVPAPEPVPERPITGKRFAVVVGVSNYSAAMGLANLEGPVADAQAMADFLTAHGFSVRLLTDSAATRQAILQALDRVSRDIDPKRGDGFVFYFAGHVLQRDDGQEGVHLVPSGAPTAEDQLASSQLWTICTSIARRSAAVALVLDASHAAQAMDADRLHRPDNLVLLGATANQWAFEKSGRGAFTAALIEELETAAPGTWASLNNRVRQRVMAETDGQQRPVVLGDVDGAWTALFRAVPEQRPSPGITAASDERPVHRSVEPAGAVTRDASNTPVADSGIVAPDAGSQRAQPLPPPDAGALDERAAEVVSGPGDQEPDAAQTEWSFDVLDQLAGPDQESPRLHKRLVTELVDGREYVLTLSVNGGSGAKHFAYVTYRDSSGEHLLYPSDEGNEDNEFPHGEARVAGYVLQNFKASPPLGPVEFSLWRADTPLAPRMLASPGTFTRGGPRVQARLGLTLVQKKTLRIVAAGDGDAGPDDFSSYGR